MVSQLSAYVIARRCDPAYLGFCVLESVFPDSLSELRMEATRSEALSRIASASVPLFVCADLLLSAP